VAVVTDTSTAQQFVTDHYGERAVALDDPDERAMRAVLPPVLSALDAVRDLVPQAAEGYGLWPAGRRGPADSWAAALLSVDEDRARTPGWRDWGNALYGDHLYDAAWLLYWWPWMPE
jgi:hypothetical protein